MDREIALEAPPNYIEELPLDASERDGSPVLISKDNQLYRQILATTGQWSQEYFSHAVLAVARQPPTAKTHAAATTQKHRTSLKTFNRQALVVESVKQP
ncbi:hypothetical protein GCT13_20825 [Paraburkholderia sp. CNPSo 3157]|uniref:Uncharacterized protein n=1 Tax=Paraburkholderia franconis TaxID=2654983 RepID=A0A7X1THI9_9BURK|nr:hypothetical protein [Paraburkholderia franconis]MPW19274.1 hypothetical protein [Paraburkholderia franconis]